MKSHSHKYNNENDLNGFIEGCFLNHHNQILVQVFSAIIDRDFISKILSEISRILPGAKIIGTTTAGDIYKGESIDSSCLITITEFAKSTVEVLEFGGNSRKITETMGRIKRFEHMKGVKAMISFCSKVLSLPYSREKT